MTNYDFISFSEIQIYDLSYIHLHLSTSTGYITNSQCDQLPDGLIAQSVEHYTGIAEVTDGFKSCSGLNVFRL